ncbi:hypothetical protein EVAR_9489_1 [Eumeta japonica]|uniref:Uncharacterized protein n=1 Tax=Eumeta variegata TaxID=151549 RepID=A0A4C2A155_EUMVA|nr:hypothetical protein EVAR_9489_1 [Eumeta japonica]
MDELVYKLEEAQSKTFQIQTLRFCFRTSNGKTRAEREQSAAGGAAHCAAARGESASRREVSIQLVTLITQSFLRGSDKITFLESARLPTFPTIRFALQLFHGFFVGLLPREFGISFSALFAYADWLNCSSCATKLGLQIRVKNLLSLNDDLNLKPLTAKCNVEGAFAAGNRQKRILGQTGGAAIASISAFGTARQPRLVVLQSYNFIARVMRLRRPAALRICERLLWRYSVANGRR